MTDEKQRLRSSMRARRAAFAAGRLAAFSVMPPSSLSLAGIVASYRPIGSEIDPAALERAVTLAGGKLVFPRVEGVGVMRFLYPQAHADWEEGPYGIVQPRSHCPALSPDVVIVPLVAFDRMGHRLGQGGGYYDRALAAVPKAFRLGIGWSVQEVDAVPIDPWDVPLHAIITEQNWISL